MPTEPETTAPRILVLHHVDGDWSAVLAQPHAGSQGQANLQLNACERVQDANLATWVGQQQVASIRVVLPGAAVVCRTVGLGDESDEALLEQRLHADTHGRPMAQLPPHRLAAAVLPAVAHVSARTGMLLSWPETQVTQLPTLPHLALAVPDIVGLLAVAGAGEAAAWIDTQSGSLSIVLQGPERLSARCMREPDPETALPSALCETAAIAGAPTASLPGTGPLRLTDEAIQRLTDRCLGDMPDALDQFGVAIGCAIACTGPLSPLTVLQQDAPRLQLSRMQRAFESMRTARTAAALVVLVIALLFVGPIVFNGARLALLQSSHPELASTVAAAEDTLARTQYYRVLSTQAWPMTKLLSDIGAAAPLGIVLEQVRIDNGEPIRIRGHATPRGSNSAADLITMMKANLQGSRVFNEITVEWDGKKRIGQREFTMVAAVRSAQLRPRYDDILDYAAWTHQQRRYNLPPTAEGGPPARPSKIGEWSPIARGSAPIPPSHPAPEPPPAEDSEAATHDTSPATTTDDDTSSQPARPTRPPSNGDRPHGRRPGTPPEEPATVDPSTIKRDITGPGGQRPEIDRPGGNASDSGSVSVGSTEFQSGDLDSGTLGAMPQILTDEQLAALNEDELRVKVSEVTKARERATDPEQQAILKDYFQRIFKRLREIRRGVGR